MDGARFLARMSKSRRNTSFLPLDDALFDVKPRKPVPHEFVLDAIATLSPMTRSMFGCLAIYVQDKIVFILRDKGDQAADNGVWLATTEDQHRSLRREFPNMRSIQVLGKKVTGWQVLPADAQDFEEAALHACDLVLAGILESGKYQGNGEHQDRRPRRQQNPRSRRRHPIMGQDSFIPVATNARSRSDLVSAGSVVSRSGLM